MINHPIPYCPICNSAENQESIGSPDGRIYYRCKVCELIYVDPSFHLKSTDEKARYDLHQNDETDERYIAFLRQAIDMALPYLKEADKILDFGCGPAPALLQEVHRLINCLTFPYDPFYYPDNPDINAPYDIIFSTEVFEHLYHPEKTLTLLNNWLKPSGYLCIMTQLYPKELNLFSNWYYARDPTHVVFYSMKTMQLIALKFNWELIDSDENRVFLFKKNQY